MAEEQDVIRHQPTQGPDLGGEEVRRDQHLEMRTDKLLPRGGRLALWSGWEAMALEDVTHGLITDGISQVGHSADDPVIAPGAIFPCHAHHQCLDFWIDSGTARDLALLGAVKFLGHKPAMPGEDR